MSERNLYRTKSSSLCLALISIIILSGCLDELGTSYEDDYVAYICYLANYEGDTLDINLIREELPNHYISYNNESSGIINCSFGETFNNISIKDTYCVMRAKTGKYNFEANVNIRLYGADELWASELNQYKPDLRDSMDYITSIIYNATGTWPNEKYFYKEDGAALHYP